MFADQYIFSRYLKLATYTKKITLIKMMDYASMDVHVYQHGRARGGPTVRLAVSTARALPPRSPLQTTGMRFRRHAD